MPLRHRTPLLLVAFTAGFSAYVEQRSAERRSERMGIGTALAVDTSLALADGRSARLGDLLRPPVTVIVFWATWCRACLVELPLLARAQQELDGVHLLGLSTDEGAAAVAAYTAAHPLAFPVARDPGGSLEKAVDLQVLPTFVVVTDQGRVVEVVEGAIPPHELPYYAARWLAKASEAGAEEAP